VKESTRAQPGNTLAVKHGSHSERQIVPRAGNQKRAFLRRIGLRERDLDPLGRGYLDLWARCQAKLVLMDEYGAAHGWIDPAGNVPGYARFYAAMANSTRLALGKLEDHLRDRHGLVDPLTLLESEGRRVRLAAEEQLDA